MRKALNTFLERFYDTMAADLVDGYNERDRKCFIDFLCQKVAQMNDEDNSILKVDKELIKKTTCSISFFGARTS